MVVGDVAQHIAAQGTMMRIALNTNPRKEPTTKSLLQSSTSACMRPLFRSMLVTVVWSIRSHSALLANTLDFQLGWGSIEPAAGSKLVTRVKLCVYTYFSELNIPTRCYAEYTYKS